MTRLSSAVVVHDDEHALSVAARLAAAQGVPLDDFCRHLGLDLRGIASGRTEAIRELAYLANVDAAWLNSHSLIRHDDFYTVGDERLLGMNLTRHPNRYCIHCLAEDRANGTGSVKARPYGRVSWQISFVCTCDVHEVGLLTVDSADLWRIDSEFSVTEFDSGVDPSSAPVRAFTEFERYVDSRLRGKSPTSETFLDGLPLHVAGTLCELVGKVVTHGRAFGPVGSTDDECVAVRQTGFNSLCRSGAPFDDFLREVTIERRSKAGPAAAKTAYNEIYRSLKTTFKHPDFDCVRQTFHRVSVEELPIGPGDDVFGPVEVRRWHSLLTASKEFGITAPTLGKMLEAAGILPKYDPNLRASATLVLEPVMRDFARRVSSLLSQTQARQLLGVSDLVFERMLELNLLAPWLRRRGTGDEMPLYNPEDVDSLIVRLRGSISITPPPTGSIDILEVRAAAGCTLDEIVGLLINKTLKHVYSDDNGSGIRSIRVDPTEVRHIIANRPPNVVDVSVCTNGFLGHEVVARLVAEGHLAPVVVADDIGGKSKIALAAWSIEVFEDRYAPLIELAGRLFTNPRSLRRELEEEGVMPFMNHPNPERTLYDVAEVARLKLGEGLR